MAPLHLSFHVVVFYEKKVSITLHLTTLQLPTAVFSHQEPEALWSVLFSFEVQITLTRFLLFRGPGVDGISPREASDRLSMFQARFDELWRKYITYSGVLKLFICFIQYHFFRCSIARKVLKIHVILRSSKLHLL